MLSYKTVAPHTLELLKELMAEDRFRDMRLVGGTALALQYGHRSSVDLDFFGSFGDSQDGFGEILSRHGRLEIVKESADIRIYLLDNIKIDFVNFKYGWLAPAVVEDGIRLASPADIAAMKIYAAVGRGSRKDFVDIYYLLQHYSFKELMGFYERKYPEHSEFVALRSLAYFDDADSHQMPQMFTDVKWEDMKSYIMEQVQSYSKS